MKLSRADLKNLIKPIVREYVEETLEHLLTEGHIANIVQESVLKGDVISHVITEVVRGYTPQVIGQPSRQPQQSQVPDDEVIQRINQLTANSSLNTMLEQRRSSYDQQDQQLPQQPQQRVELVERTRKPDWSSVAGAIPPDDDSVGLTAPVKGYVHEVDNHLNPLGRTVGAGIDTRIIKELNSKALWDKKKLDRFLNMGKIQTQSIKKTNLQEIAKNKDQ